MNLYKSLRWRYWKYSLDMQKFLWPIGHGIASNIRQVHNFGKRRPNIYEINTIYWRFLNTQNPMQWKLHFTFQILRITERYNIHIDTQREFIYIYNHVVSLYRKIDLTSIAIKLEHATQSFKPFSRHVLPLMSVQVYTTVFRSGTRQYNLRSTNHLDLG